MPLLVVTQDGEVSLPDSDYEIVRRFAVHHAILPGKKGQKFSYGREWVVTHVKTGRCVGSSTATKRNARRVMFALEAVSGWDNYSIEDYNKPIDAIPDSDGFYWAVRSIVTMFGMRQ